MVSFEHIHPMVVHFPIALILVGFVAEAAYFFFKREPLFSAASLWLFSVGTVSAVFAYVSGAFLTKQLYSEAGSVQSLHELFAEITVISALIGTTFKIYLKTEKKEDSALKWIGFAIYAFTVISVSITGHYGGMLVYRYLIPGGS
ncbi:MAG TPA: DUF2231 domain-containing protein [Draconibacterium sp.]|jgi:uncharacterized membrane protein|nr:DUF2231 domain-containing protein [Draconibacterium sp.]